MTPYSNHRSANSHGFLSFLTVSRQGSQSHGFWEKSFRKGSKLGARSFGIFRNKNIFRNIFCLFCYWEQNSRNGNPGIPGWEKLPNKRLLALLFQLFLFRIDPKRTHPKLWNTNGLFTGNAPLYLTTFLYRAVIFACVQCVNNLSFISASVRRFVWGVGPGNEVGVLFPRWKRGLIGEKTESHYFCRISRFYFTRGRQVCNYVAVDVLFQMFLFLFLLLRITPRKRDDRSNRQL